MAAQETALLRADHRINKTMYNLSAFMNGDVQEMIDSLKMAENAEKMKEGGI